MNIITRILQSDPPVDDCSIERSKKCTSLHTVLAESW